MKTDTYPADLSSIVAMIKQTVPEGQRGQVLRALKNEPVFWAGINHPAFRDLAIEKFNGETVFWSPGNLALLALDSPVEASFLRNQPTYQIDAELSKLADQTLKGVITGGLKRESGIYQDLQDPLTPLKQAGLVALALRDRYLQEGSWLPVLLMRPEDEDRTWCAALACLFTYIPEPYAYLKALINPEALPSRIFQGLHAVLSNPVPLQEQKELLHMLLQEFSVPGQVDVLELLQGRSALLASTLAREIAGQFNSQSQEKHLSFPARINLLAKQAALLALAGDRMKAINNLDEAWKATLDLQAGFADQLAVLTTQGSDSPEGSLKVLEAWNASQNRISKHDSFLGRYAIALCDANRVNEAQHLINQATDTAIVLLAKTLLANHPDIKDKESARILARQTLETVLGHQGDPNFSLHTDELRRLAELLLMGNLPYEAIKATQLAIANQDNPELLSLLGQAQLNAGLQEQAAVTLETAVMLQPDWMDLRQRYAEALEAAGRWESALQERTTILERVSTPSAMDLRALANCALSNGEAKLALEVCDQALQLDPADGLASSLKGRALMALGKTEFGLETLRNATQKSPHHPTPWLNLADGWRQIGDFDKAMDTLRTATHAVPDSAEIYFSLGQEYARKNALTQAIEAYENGARLDPSNPQIALHHGKALLAVGHLHEAKQVVQAAYEARPGIVELAYTYAQIVSGLGDPHSALRALATVIQSAPNDAGPYLAYGRALIQVGDRTGEAVKVLTHVRELEPDNLEAKVLYADAAILQNNHEDALAIYHEVLNTSIIEEPRWRTHLSLGIARASLHLERYDAAIASLREALDHDPDNFQIYQYLAESYAKAALRTDALEAAQEALRLGADDLDNLTWFAEIAGNLQAEAEAVSALRRALELAPGRTDLHVLLGHTQLNSNQHEDAWETFSQVLQLNPSIPDLKSAAEGFLALNDPNSAVQHLKRAVKISDQFEISLWILLFDAQHRSGQIEAAIETIDQAINFDGKRPDLHLLKARAMLTSDRPQAARACLQHALTLAPEDPDILEAGVEILQLIGEFAPALELAEKYLLHNPKDLGALYNVADLARSLLQVDYAFRVLRDGWPLEPTNYSETVRSNRPPLQLEKACAYYCLYGEISLENDDELAAAEGLTQAMRIKETDSRVLALQARLDARTGELAAGLATLTRILEMERDEAGGASISGGHADSPVALAIAAAALDLEAWQIGLDRLRTNPRVKVGEPYANLLLARILGERAETYRFYKSLNIRKNLPDKKAIADEAYREFEQAISAAREGSSDSKSEARIARWAARGETVFAQTLQSVINLASSADDPSDWAALILAYARQGDNVQAMECAQKFPHHPKVQAALAVAMQTKNPTAALQAAQIAGRQEAHNPVILATLALAAAHARDLVTARKAMEDALTIWPDETEWHIVAGNLLVAMGGPEDLPLASAHFEKACNLEPENPYIFAALGDLQVQTGELSEAIDTLEKAVSMAPQDGNILYSLASAYYSKGDLEKANARIESALAANQNELAAYQLRAKIALDQANPHEALTRIQEARSLAPANANSLRLEAKALSALNRHSEALKSLEDALAESDNPLPLLIERIHLIRKVEGLEPALQALKQLNAGYPDDPEVFSLMARAMAENNQVEEAIFAAKQAIRKGADVLEVNDLSDLHFLLGRLLRREGQRDQAIHYLSEAIHLKPKRLDPYIELSQTYLERRDYAEALEILNQAIKIAPDDSRAFYQAGLALKENKEYLQSEKMLRRAAELAPNDLRIHRLLGAVVALNIVHNNREVVVEI